MSESVADERIFEGLLRWRCIGPVRGGRVVAVSGSYDDPGTFYFGAVAGGVWKTTNGGVYWRPVSDGYFTTASVGALAVAPSDSNVVYAGTGETTIRIDVSHGDGVYKSTDAGRTWANVGLRDTRHIGKIRVHPQNPDVVWVAALGHAFGQNRERGVFKSVDGGATWNQVLFVSDKAGAVDLSVDETNPRILYATIWEAFRSPWMISSGGPDSGLWRSVDGGDTWEDISRHPGLPVGTLGKLGVAASPAKAGRVWSLIEHAKEGGLYRSDDYGDHWEKVSDNQNLVSRAWYYIHLTADPEDADTVWVNNLEFWKSSDGGKTFEEYATPHGDNHDLWIDPRHNQRMIQGNDGGACVSYDGGQTFSTIYNQPTAQFYHLGIDTKEPYTVYGTQQDNSSIGVPSRVNHAAITWQDSFLAGTGESGYIVPKPDDPEVIYVGAIGSSPGGGNALQRYDRRTDQIRLITSWPESMGGTGASELKQRFNWTYPIVFSPHDPNTVYIGGDRVLRTTDEGQTWEPISPDLTRADPETLQATGGPVNKDAIGAETYATVYSFIESPHEAGVFWSGSDDGLIHVSRDGGKSWQDVTPPDLPEWTMMSGIEPSPFDPGTVYVAGTRYKLDDYRPYLYVTRDYGEHWSRIDAGIPADDFTRVIRCDPAKAGLLYAGTETGVHVSFDDGANWRPFQLNLPVAPIYDLLVKGTDLIAGTHGRSIWILDDLTPLHAAADGVPAGEPYLFAPRPTERWLPGIDWSGAVKATTNYLGSRGGGYEVETTADGELVTTFLDAGENAPRGAIVTYLLPDDADPERPIALTFKKASGKEVCTFTSRTTDDEPIAKERRVPAKAGWNRFVWDLRYAPATKIEGKDPPAEETIAGPIVAPGEYEVTLKVGDVERRRTFSVVKPANRPASQADLEAQEDLLVRVHRQVDRTVIAINRMRDVREQLDGWAKRTKSRDGAESIAEAAEALRDKVLEIEKTLLVPDLRPGWADALNEGVKLLAKLAGLTPLVALGDYLPTAAAESVFADLTERIEAEIDRFDALVKADLPPFVALVKKAKLDVVIVA
ncbi:MAG: glycosyl hydrolase [Chloroflexia bacterium]|nr:glycosyl hydrolase [Chloroflexia bacterium]